jgi:hypothetical protein
MDQPMVFFRHQYIVCTQNHCYDLMDRLHYYPKLVLLVTEYMVLHFTGHASPC